LRRGDRAGEVAGFPFPAISFPRRWNDDDEGEEEEEKGTRRAFETGGP